MIDSKDIQSEDDTDAAIVNNRRRNRKNVMLWSERDTKMFFVRISAALDEQDDEYKQPARLPPCFTDEERQMIHGPNYSNTEAQESTVADGCTYRTYTGEGQIMHQVFRRN